MKYMINPQLKEITDILWENWEENRIDAQYAMLPELIGCRMFEYPLVAAAAADDPWFMKMKTPGIIGPHYLTPNEWLPEAKTVISFFFPFTAEVIESNRKNRMHASTLWQHARIDGEVALLAWKRRLKEMLSSKGSQALVPPDDPRYKVTEPITSNWSERHAAFIAGLGTFGISRGLITEKGMAGRFGSVITSMQIESTKRAYTGVYEYCAFCGACAKRCPAGAIRMDLPPDQAKDQYICGKYLDILKDLTKAGKDTRPEEEQSPYEPPLHREYFGCGKCQVGVPCEHQRPRVHKGQE